MDIYTESSAVDPDTLRNLGPLAALAGVWEGHGSDVHPVAEGTETEAFVERAELHPIDPQSNGPQLLYGLRYHLWICKVGETETFHDQVGYWLWEPATKTIVQTLAIPRAQVAMASGTAEPDARRFTVRAVLGSPTFGICSGPFLDAHFKTLEYFDHGDRESRRHDRVHAGHASPDPGSARAVPSHRHEHVAQDRRGGPESAHALTITHRAGGRPGARPTRPGAAC